MLESGDANTFDAVDLEGFGLAFDFGSREFIAQKVFADGLVGGVRDDHFASGGLAAKSGGDVDVVADDGEFESFLGAHVSCDDLSAVDADTCAKRRSAIGDAGVVEVFESDLDLVGSQDGAARIFGAALGGSPDGHDGIADKFVESAFVSKDDIDQKLEVFVEIGDELFGVVAFAHGGEATDIGEHDGGFGEFTPHADGEVVFVEAIHDGGGEKALEVSADQGFFFDLAGELGVFDGDGRLRRDDADELKIFFGKDADGALCIEVHDAEDTVARA